MFALLHDNPLPNRTIACLYRPTDRLSIILPRDSWRQEGIGKINSKVASETSQNRAMLKSKNEVGLGKSRSRPELKCSKFPSWCQECSSPISIRSSLCQNHRKFAANLAGCRRTPSPAAPASGCHAWQSMAKGIFWWSSTTGWEDLDTLSVP